MLKVGFARTFPSGREQRVRRHPAGPCETTHLFRELPNVLMTAHVSGSTDASFEARARRIAENIRLIARGATRLSLISL
jgi:phosphoglycerate dehydrogenase-like enzyme